MKLYGYFRSSAAYRVRIALGLKGLDYEYAAVHLRKGEQSAPGYRELNPGELVPTLVDDRGTFTQSLAIIEYLDQRYPEPALLPSAPEARARVRAIALAIACDIHPLDNLRVLRYLLHTIGASEAAKDARSNPNSRGSPRPGSSATEAARRSPIAASFRNSPTRGAPVFPSTRIPRSCASKRDAIQSPHSPRRRRRGNRTPNESLVAAGPVLRRQGSFC